MSAMFGNTMGTVMTFAVVGAISDVANWAWGFVFVGGFTIFYLIFVAIVLADSPDQSRWCSDEEKEFLRSEIPPPRAKVRLIFHSVKILKKKLNYGLVFSWSLLIKRYLLRFPFGACRFAISLIFGDYSYY